MTVLSTVITLVKRATLVFFLTDMIRQLENFHKWLLMNYCCCCCCEQISNLFMIFFWRLLLLCLPLSLCPLNVHAYEDTHLLTIGIYFFLSLPLIINMIKIQCWTSLLRSLLPSTLYCSNRTSQLAYLFIFVKQKAYNRCSKVLAYSSLSGTKMLTTMCWLHVYLSR